MKTKIITICGSSKFVDIMEVCSWLIERDEKAITMSLHLLPGWYPDCPAHHLAEHEGVAKQMDALHLRKIDISDEIFVVNYENYIGESTRKEIEYSQSLKTFKLIRWFTNDAIGEAVSKMMRAAAGKD